MITTHARRTKSQQKETILPKLRALYNLTDRYLLSLVMNRRYNVQPATNKFRKIILLREGTVQINIMGAWWVWLFSDIHVQKQHPTLVRDNLIDKNHKCYHWSQFTLTPIVQVIPHHSIISWWSNIFLNIFLKLCFQEHQEHGETH